MLVVTYFSSFLFSLQTVYDEWFITLYNLVYTALPVIALSIFDQVCLIYYTYVNLNHVPIFSISVLICVFNIMRCGVLLQDVNDRWSFQYPQLYSPGQLNQYFSKMAFVRILLHSCYSSLILFFIPWAAMNDTVRDDGKEIADYQSFALLAQTCLLIAVNVQVNSDIQYRSAIKYNVQHSVQSPQNTGIAKCENN